MNGRAGTDRLAVEAERRTYRAWEEDGLADLTAAPLFVVFAFWFIVPDGYRLYVVLLGVAAFFTSRRLLEAAKRCLTDRRSGHVRLARPEVRQTWRESIAVGLLAGALAFLSSLLERSFPSLPPLQPLQGMVYGYVAAFVAYAWKSGLRRYYLQALVPLLTAAIIWPMEDGRVDDRAVLNIAIALALLVGGLVALHGYLRVDRGAEREEGSL